MTKKQKKTLKRIIISAVLYLAIILASKLVAIPWYLELVLFLVPYFIIGHDVLRKAVLGIVHGEVFDENFLMAVATVGALCLGEFSESVAVMLFYQIGELFQSYAVGKSRKSISDLMDIRPDSANLETADGTVSTVDPDDVPIGSVLVVRPGEKVPIDGEVISGESTLNTAALTGESKPRFVHPGSEIISGCVNGDGLLKLRTTKLYGESTVAKILDMVENSSLKKARAENFITKFAHYYTPAVCIGALVLAILPPLVLGGGYGWMLNKIKGGEMMVATYVGFSSVSFMCMMWLLLPYKSPTMVWGFAGKGLRTTISLEGFYDQFLAKFLQIDLNRFGINLVIPTGSLLFFALLAFLMWVFLHTKTGTAMTAVGSNPTFAKAAGISVDKTRLLSVVLSTWLGAVGILLYEQGFGFVQIYMAPLNMAFPAVAAILIGGASVNKASITNVIIGTILYQGLVTMTPTVMNAIVHLDISEVIRIIVSNGMIVYALTRKTEGGK